MTKKETWFDQECKKVMNERSEAYKKNMPRRTREKRMEFECSRRMVHKLFRSRKTKYENSLIEKWKKISRKTICKNHTCIRKNFGKDINHKQVYVKIKHDK